VTASVAAFLEKVRERGAELPPALTAALLLAAVKLSEARAVAIRPDLLQVDHEGGIDLHEGALDAESAYASPELRSGAVLPNDPRAMVYAAGALGYELSTLKTLPPGAEAGPEIQGPLAPVIRKALAQDRKKRWRDLEQMGRAIALVQAPPTNEEQRLILAAVAQTSGAGQKKLARIELQKAPAPAPAPPAPNPPPVETPQAVHPLFAQRWDPLETPPEVFFQPPEGEEPGVVELHESQVREAHNGEPVPEAVPEPEPRPAAVPEPPPRDELREEMMVLGSRLENLARLGSRISALEEHVKSSAPPAPAATASEVALVIEQQWKDEAQRKVDLGHLLVKQGKKKQAMALYRAALALDPANVEAEAAVGVQRPAFRAALPAIGGALVGAGAALMAMVALRPPPPAPQPPPAPVMTVAVPVPPPAPAPIVLQAPPLPVSKPEARTEVDKPSPPAAVPPPAPRKPPVRKSPAAAEHAALGDKALRAFNTSAARTAFETALKEDPSLPAAHRGLGMVYVLLGKNDEAKAEYEKYLQLAPDAPDADQIKRLLAR
jgi:tetratricopeptide (TPR) repeat protein